MSIIAANLCRKRMATADWCRQMAAKHPEGSAAREDYRQRAENWSAAAYRAQLGDTRPVNHFTGLIEDYVMDERQQHIIESYPQGVARRQGGQPYGSSGVGFHRHRIVEPKESWLGPIVVFGLIVAGIALCGLLS